MKIHKEDYVVLAHAGDEICMSLKEAHQFHDQLTTFINNNPLPDDET